MTQSVYLHVGAPKSGTTYLQGVLEHNRAALAQAGVLVVGRHQLDRIHAAMVIRQDPRLRTLPPSATTAWTRLVREIRDWRGPAAILSYELFAAASAEQAAAAIADLAGLEVHVVITARDFGRSVPSAWQERLKFALTTPLEQWQPRPGKAGSRAEWGWRTMDPAGVASRWGASLPAERVHIVTVPREAGDGQELWRRFAGACGLDPDAYDTATRRSNESLGVVAAELLRRVNEQVGDPITGNREQALWLRDTLAHGILADLDREPIGLTDEQFEVATKRATKAIDKLSAAGYDVRGDLADLRATRPQARTPGQVSDAELLGVAVAAVIRLLLLVRERSQSSRRTHPDQPGGRLARLTGRLSRRVVAPYAGAQTRRLQEQVAALEAELAASRGLHLRVAELSDVVTELLLPAEVADHEVTRLALEKYREESL